MIKQKFVNLLACLACSLLCVAAVQPVRAEEDLVTDQGNVNSIYSAVYMAPSSIDFVTTDLTTGNSQKTPGFTLAENNQSFDAFTALQNGTFVGVSSRGSTYNQYLYLSGANSQTLPISGLPTKASYFMGLMGLPHRKLLAIVNPNNGNSYVLESIDLHSGQATDTGFPLPKGSFNSLTQCPDGTIYALTGGPNFSTSKNLVKLDLAQQQVINGPLLQQSDQPPIATNNLACSPQGNLYVTGVRNANANGGEGSFLPPDLFLVDKNTGELTTVLQPFNYNSITFIPKRPALSSAEN